MFSTADRRELGDTAEVGRVKAVALVASRDTRRTFFMLEEFSSRCAFGVGGFGSVTCVGAQ